MQAFSNNHLNGKPAKQCSDVQYYCDINYNCRYCDNDMKFLISKYHHMHDTTVIIF